MEKVLSPPVVIPKEYDSTVIEKRTLYQDVYFLQLRTVSPISFIAGQYASFILRDIRRPYSFACMPGKNTLDFIVGTREEGTTHDVIQQLNVGDSLPFLAPYGRFVFESNDTRPILFIAGGTGIAPIRAQLQAALAHNPNRTIKLYFAHHDSARLFLSQEFIDLEKQHHNFQYVPVLSSGGADWLGKKGRVTRIIPSDIQNLPDYTAYVCGSPDMVKDTVKMLLYNNVPAKYIHFEQFT